MSASLTYPLTNPTSETQSLYLIRLIAVDTFIHPEKIYLNSWGALILGYKAKNETYGWRPYDFVGAKTHDGRTVRVLNLIDEHTLGELASSSGATMVKRQGN